MANHKSAAKRARQDEKKRARNLSTKRAVRSAEKQLRTAIADKDSSKAEAALITFSSKISRAAKKGIYHSNTVARKVSRLASQISALAK